MAVRYSKSPSTSKNLCKRYRRCFAGRTPVPVQCSRVDGYHEARQLQTPGLDSSENVAEWPDAVVQVYPTVGNGYANSAPSGYCAGLIAMSLYGPTPTIL